MGLAESFVDELRTYAYVIEKVSGPNDPDKTKLLAMMPLMDKLLNSLDISQRDFNFSPESLKFLDRIKMMSEPGIYQVLGQECVNNFVANFEAIQPAIQQRIGELEALGFSLEDLNTNPEKLRNFTASDVVKLQIYSNLDKSMHYLLKNLLEDYLGGNNIIYIKNN